MKTCTVLAIRGGLIFSCALVLEGCTNVLGFSTATKVGLDVSQRADQVIDVSMGYDRAEVASIPAPDHDDAKDSPAESSDAYSVLGTFDVKYGNPFSDDPLVLDQLFATGLAARRAARSTEMQEFFGREARDIVTKQRGGE